ncbi:ribonuclease P protein component [Nocardioides sp. CER19]|uniref:ribonuclease P protein component n=1 Tax=Nocardioides sp. CER19 TaxID=3038538 RepID=UPI002446FC6D|nr:ribonuclease P protein component [Nocardioides sp. CER19]MDH2412797.1 ribonuclease P protein component [Nocardioides sp. CER19]
MLARAHRLTDAADFASAVRGGRRAGSRTLVLHLESLEGEGPVRVGFVVSKAVGPAVTRNRVKRRLRHLAREQLSVTETPLPGSAVLVVRALPAAAGADYEELRADLARCWERVTS